MKEKHASREKNHNIKKQREYKKKGNTVQTRQMSENGKEKEDCDDFATYWNDIMAVQTKDAIPTGLPLHPFYHPTLYMGGKYHRQDETLSHRSTIGTRQPILDESSTKEHTKTTKHTITRNGIARG
jgi:hypothetical protein